MSKLNGTARRVLLISIDGTLTKKRPDNVAAMGHKKILDNTYKVQQHLAC